MKATALALLLFPIACLAQTKTAVPSVKPSTTACPDFVNKPQVSKAAYFESLRHVKPKDPLVASSVKKEKTEKAPSTSTNNYIPSYSSSDKILEKKEKPVISTKPVVEEIAEKPVEKELIADKGTRAEKKMSRKKQSCNTSGKVKTSKKNTQKCPRF
jgi:hypothetical protein